MDRPGERRMTEAYLNGNATYLGQNRLIVRSNMNNSNDFNEVFLKLHEAINDPRYDQQMRLKTLQIQQWNRDLQYQQEENRRNLGNKLSSIKGVVGGDPALQPLSMRIDNILADYNRNINKDLPNHTFIEHNKKRNHDSLLVSDDQLSKTNTNPQFSGSPEIGRTSTVKVYLNNDNQVIRHEVEKAYIGDDIRLIQIKQAASSIQVQPRPEDRINTGSPHRRGKPTRTPVKQTVEIQREQLKTNPDYDKSRQSYSPQSQKIIYANDTDPHSSTKKRQRPVEKLIVTTNEGNMVPSKPKDEGDRVIVREDGYRPPRREDNPPRPFSQYPVYDRRVQDPLEMYLLHQERAYYYRNQMQPYHPQSYQPQSHTPASGQFPRDIRPIEPYFEEIQYYGSTLGGKRVMLPRKMRYLEQREVGIVSSVEYFKQPQTFQEVPIENRKSSINCS